MLRACEAVMPLSFSYLGLNKWGEPSSEPSAAWCRFGRMPGAPPVRSTDNFLHLSGLPQIAEFVLDPVRRAQYNPEKGVFDYVY